MAELIRIINYSQEYVNSYYQNITFKYLAKPYSVTLYWDTNDGYEVVFNEGNENELELDMGDAYDDFASMLEDFVAEAEMKAKEKR